VATSGAGTGGNRDSSGRFRKGAGSPNPGGRKKRHLARLDNLTNVVTGLGTQRDKRMFAEWAALAVSDREAQEIWRSDGIASRIVELPPKGMFREGYEIKLEDKEQSEEVVAFLDDMGADDKLIRGKCFERAYGGGAIWPIINDGAGDLAMPLRQERILTLEKLSRVLEPQELSPWTYDDDGDPDIWLFSPVGQRGGGLSQILIHDSRLIRFPGKKVTHEQMSGVREGWGDSVFTRIKSRLRDLAQGSANAAALLGQSSQAIVKLKDLALTMANDGDALVKDRLVLLDFCRSVLKMMPIDAEDDFSWQTSPMTGFAETIDRLMQMLSADTGIPVTILMGRSPAGMNSTGDADVRGFYDLISEEQRETTPQVEKLIRLVLLAKNGPTGGVEPDVWSVEWNPLWQPTEKEQAEARKIQAETDKIYVELGVLAAAECARSRFGGDTYSFNTVIDFDEREREEEAAPPPVKSEQELEDEAAAKAQMEAALEGVKTGVEEGNEEQQETESEE
jgi:hypothetical protein